LDLFHYYKDYLLLLKEWQPCVIILQPDDKPALFQRNYNRLNLPNTAFNAVIEVVYVRIIHKIVSRPTQNSLAIKS